MNLSSPVRRLPVVRPAGVVALTASALLAAGLLAVVPAAARADAAPSAASATPAGRYYPVTPVRALDTRLSGGAIRNGGTRVVDLSRYVGNASAAVINLTVTAPTGAGYLTAYPAGTRQPLASSINYAARETRANSVTVALGQGGAQDQLAISALVTGGGTVHVVVDVLGWYGNGGGAAGSSYQPLLTPTRLFDTRTSIGALTSTAPRNTGIVTIDYGSPQINKTIQAAVMNLTVTNTRGPGYITAWDGDGAPPLSSTLNFSANQTVANLAVVPVRCQDTACSKVTFSIKNSFSPSTQVVGDISGIYATPSAAGLLYRPVAPTRVTDTRRAMPYSRLNTGGAGVTDVSGVIPAGTRAVNINLTGVNPATNTYLRTYPAVATMPLVSNLNMTSRTVAANAVQVRVAGGRFTTANTAGLIDVVIDLEGTFGPDPSFA